VRRLSSLLGLEGRVFHVVGRQVAHQFADEVKASASDSAAMWATPLLALWVMAPPKFFEGHVFAGDGLNHVWPGDEHVAAVFDHEDEVGEGGGVDRAARARPHDGADLGDDAGGQGVAQEDVGITARLTTPSWMRAPPESLMPMTGAPLRMAMSMILQIFSAWTPLRLPPKTVKSWLKT
jgi:hypothetical protein